MQYRNIKKSQSGFTLIELLITVAIVAILAIIGATVYASFGARAQASEGLRVSEGMKHAYEVYAAENGGVPPLTLSELALGSINPDDFGGRFVASAGVSGGQIVMFYKAAPDVDAPLAGTSLVLTPYETAVGQIVWHCGNEPALMAADGITPLNVAGTAAGSPITGVSVTGAPDAVLPSQCRS